MSQSVFEFIALSLDKRSLVAVTDTHVLVLEPDRARFISDDGTMTIDRDGISLSGNLASKIAGC